MAFDYENDFILRMSQALCSMELGQIIYIQQGWIAGKVLHFIKWYQ